MTSVDKLITSDLALLASDSRQHLRTVDATLAAIGTGSVGPEGSAREPALPLASHGLAVLALANVFTRRISRAATGAMALLCAVALLIVLANPWGYELYEMPHREHWFEIDAWWCWFLEGSGLSTAAAIAAVLAGTQLIARRIAAQWFERRMREAVRSADMVAAGRRLVHRVDPWAAYLEVAGATSLVTLVGVVTFVVGLSSWGWFWYPGNVNGYFSDRLRDLAIAIPAIVVAAVPIARSVGAAPPAPWLQAVSRWGLLPLGLVLGITTLTIGFSFDSGIAFPNVFEQVGRPLTSALRSGLTASGATATLLVVAGLTLRRRRRDLDAINDAR
jgi:hypothetical protein